MTETLDEAVARLLDSRVEQDPKGWDARRWGVPSPAVAKAALAGLGKMA